MNIIDINNFNFFLDENQIFSNLNLKIRENSFNYLTGRNSSGKTTLLKIIGGLYDSDNIYFNNKLVSSNILKTNTAYISFNNIFYSKTILDELELLSEKNIKSYIKKLLVDFNLIKYINKSPLELSIVEKTKLKIIQSIINKKKIILIDNIFTKYTFDESIETLRTLKEYSKKNNFTVIISSMDSNLIFEFENIIILNNKKVIYNDNYLEEELFKSNNLDIPFICELSNKLRLYDLIKKDVYEFEDLVNEIC